MLVVRWVGGGWVSMGGYLWVGGEIYIGDESCGRLGEK